MYEVIILVLASCLIVIIGLLGITSKRLTRTMKIEERHRRAIKSLNDKEDKRIAKQKEIERIKQEKERATTVKLIYKQAKQIISDTNSPLFEKIYNTLLDDYKKECEAIDKLTRN